MTTYNELYHHGILGMKWGVRRYQNEDGTRTALGKERERNILKTASDKHYAKVKQKYTDAGFDDDYADKAAKRRIKTERLLLAAGGIAAASVVGYAAYKHYQMNADSVINSGAILQRIKRNDGAGLHNYFYAAIDPHDKQKYAGLFGKQMHDETGDGAYKMDINVLGDAKIAGKKSAGKIFSNLISEDSEFKNYIENNRDFKNALAAVTGEYSGKVDYEKFNRSFLADKSEEGIKMQQKYFDAIRNAGYSGFKDINDMKYSGYNAKNPVIMVNDGKQFTVNKISKLNNETIESNYNAEINKLAGSMFAEMALRGTATYGTAIGAALLLQDMGNEKIHLSDKQKQDLRRQKRK